MREFLTAVLLATVMACSAERAPLVATDVSIRKPLPGMTMSAGYLALTNNTGQVIIITSVTSPDFGTVEMHETVLEDGISRMRELGDVAIPAGETVRFEPGGRHLMLMRPETDAGPVTLEFRTDEAVVLTITATFEG